MLRIWAVIKLWYLKDKYVYEGKIYSPTLMKTDTEGNLTACQANLWHFSMYGKNAYSVHSSSTLLNISAFYRRWLEKITLMLEEKLVAIKYYCVLSKYFYKKYKILQSI